MAQLQTVLPDALLEEAWTLMHLVVAPDTQPHGYFVGTGPSSKDSPLELNVRHSSQGGNPPGFICEGDIDDGDFDGNANESSNEDLQRQALRETADLLASMGDRFNQDGGEANNVVHDLVQYFNGIFPNIDERLERVLTSHAVPVSDIFQETLVKVAYSEVKSRLERFLMGRKGFSKIVMVTHTTIGVSAALRNVSAPAVSLAAALSYRFLTDNCADIILEGGGMRKLVHSNLQ